MLFQQIYYAFVMTMMFFSKHIFTMRDPENYYYHNQALSNYIFLIILNIILFLLIITTMKLAERYLNKYYDKILFIIFFLSLYNFLDYIRDIIFRPLPDMSFNGRIAYLVIFTLYIPMLIIMPLIFKKLNYEKIHKSAISLFTLIAILAVYYIIPKEFSVTHIDKELKPGKRNNIHLILFDGVAYVPIYNGDKISEEFPNIAELAKNSCVFYNGYSPGTQTFTSMGRLTTGINYKYFKAHYCGLYGKMNDNDEWNKVDVSKSLFKVSKDYGYNNVLLGEYHQYGTLFEKYLDYARVYSVDSKYNYMLGKLINYLFLRGDIYARDTFYALFKGYIEKANENKSNTLFFTHFNTPHVPYIFNKNGFKNEYHKMLLKGTTYKEEERYLDQLRYVDVKVGEIIKTLKENGSYEDSLIILTTDHPWPWIYRKESERIPFIIKKPNQKKGLKIYNKSYTFNSNKMLKKYYKTNKIDLNILSEYPGEFVK
ncbi:MAG: hypothetical protein A2252_07480 [Elusimicrobia bacterium RIFOXYA2_FULL_39_19]|nr:MAG: hypothetical protein A2252_07480 [Elusimicrobia bacterium RIFOXYA2_FULL_39_19]